MVWNLPVTSYNSRRFCPGRLSMILMTCKQGCPGIVWRLVKTGIEFMLLSVLTFASLWLLTGCDKKEAAPQSSVSASQPVSLEAQPQAPVAADSRQFPVQASTPNAAPMVSNPVVVPAGSDMTAILAQLTQAVRRYGAEKQRVPASLNEVLGAGYVSGAPQAPPGKKFAIDPKRLEVILVKQ